MLETFLQRRRRSAWHKKDFHNFEVECAATVGGRQAREEGLFDGRDVFRLMLKWDVERMKKVIAFIAASIFTHIASAGIRHYGIASELSDVCSERQAYMLDMIEPKYLLVESVLSLVATALLMTAMSIHIYESRR